MRVHARDEVCGFRFTRAAWGELSNFRPLSTPIPAGPWTFATAEHLYQAAKFAARPDLQERIAMAATAKEAKVIGGTGGASIDPGWGRIATGVSAGPRRRSGGFAETARGPNAVAAGGVDGDPLMRLIGRVVQTDLPDNEYPRLAKAVEEQLQLERQRQRKRQQRETRRRRPGEGHGAEAACAATSGRAWPESACGGNGRRPDVALTRRDRSPASRRSAAAN